MDHQPDEEDGGEDLKVRPVKMGTKATVSRIRSATVYHHLGCPRRVIKGSRCHDEGVSGKQEQESVAEHVEGGVVGIPEYCPDF